MLQSGSIRNQRPLCLLIALLTTGFLSPALSAQTAHSNVNAVNFGTVAIGARSPAKSLVFTFDTGGSLGNLPSVYTQGAPNLDFTDAATGTCTTNGPAHVYAKGDTCTVDVTFTPKHHGPRYGAAVLSTTSGTMIATANVYGVGSGPQVRFLPGMRSGNWFWGYTDGGALALDGSDTAYFAVNYPGMDFIEDENPGRAFPIVPYGYLANQISIDGAGNLYFGGSNGNLAGIFEAPLVGTLSFGQQGLVRTLVSETSSGPGYGSVTIDRQGNLYAVSPSGNLEEIEAVNGVIPDTPKIRTVAAGFSGQGLVIDGNGDLWLNGGNGKITEVDAVDGVIPTTPKMRSVASGVADFQYLAIDGSGNLYVSSSDKAVFNELVAVNGVVPSSPVVVNLLEDITLKVPEGVAVDGEGSIFAMDNANHSPIMLDRATPPTLAFGTATPGSTSNAAKVATLENFGDSALQFSAISYPSDFPEDASGATDCTASTSLPPGATCTFTVTFRAPILAAAVTSEPLSESVSFTTNAGNTPTIQTIPVTGTAAKLNPAVALASSNTVPSPGNSVTFTTTVTGTGQTPTGTVTFLVNGTSASGSTVALKSGIATWSTTTLATGTDTVTAAYSGDTLYSPSTSNTVIEQVTIKTPTVALATSRAIVVPGEKVTFTATLSGTYGTPTGTVSFYSALTLLSTVNLTSGVATWSTSSLPLGTDSITAKYSGNITYTSATSPALSELITKSGTLLLSSISAQVNITSPITLTATVVAPTAGPVPTGSFKFYEIAPGDPTLGLIPLTNGKATLSITNLPEWKHTFLARYTGDPHYSGGVSNSTVVIVNKIPSSMALTASPNPVAPGSQLTLKAALATTLTGKIPTGTVNFYLDGKDLGAFPVSNGTAIYQTTSLPTGKHLFAAQYNGDQYYVGYQGSVVRVSVGTPTSVAISPQSVYGNAPFTQPFTVTVAETLAGEAPTGHVVFYLNGTVVGTTPLVNMSAVYPIALPWTSSEVNAVYSGDSTYQSTTSPTVEIFIQK